MHNLERNWNRAKRFMAPSKKMQNLMAGKGWPTVPNWGPGGIFPLGQGPHTLEKRVKRLENRRGEWKRHDVTYSGTAPNGGVVQALSLIEQGDKVGDREGDVIYLQSVQARWKLKSTVVTNDAIVRLMLFFDTRQDGDLTNMIDDIIGTTGTPYMNLKGSVQKGRYQMLFDKTYVLTRHTAGTSPQIFDQYYKKFGGRKIYYKDGTATQAGQSKGNLYLLAVSDHATYVTLEFHGRLRYTDV